MSSNADTGPRPTGSLLDTVEHLEEVAFVPAKQRHTDAGQLAKTIASDAYESGIPHAILERLLKILTASNSLDQTTTTTLVKNLYPLEQVSSKMVTQVVCCFGPSKNKPTPATQALLLRWLLLVYDSLEDRAHLSKLYAVLFNYLDMISLRKPLCHLLSLITRRKHVKPFRIQALMGLLRNAGGDDKELTSLLKVFKNYYPDIIVGDLGLRSGLFFKHPDPEWSSHARNLQDKNVDRSRTAQQSSFQVVHRGLVKRSKTEIVVPDVQTSRVSHGRTSLEELRGVDHFVEKLDQIELPNQMISTLGDRFAQKYLFLVQSEAANARLEDWLMSFLNDKLERIQDGDDDEPETLTYVLSFAVEYVRYAKETPTAIASFVKRYLVTWNGHDNREQVFQLLEYLPIIESFGSLRQDFLAPLEAAVLDNTLASRIAILEFYSSLILQWGVKLRTQPSTSGESKPLSRLILHAELLALSILEISPTSHLTDSSAGQSKPATLSVVEFYSALAEVFSYASVNGNIRLTVPLSPTVYTLVFTPMSSVISIISSVLASYKSSFEASLTSEVLQTPNGSENLYPTQLVGRFNGYVMDICNLVWRNRGLNNEDPNALGCLIPASTVTMLTQYIRECNEISRERKREASFHYTLVSIFSLSHHAALCNISAACFADIEEENGLDESKPKLKKPVTQKALSALEKGGGVKMSWQEYRVRMLDWLDAAGNRGIGDLMRSTMKALRKE